MTQRDELQCCRAQQTSDYPVLALTTTCLVVEVAGGLCTGGIGLFILPRTWTLLRDAVGVLLEGTPSGINIASLRETIAAVPGVSSVHDLHVWSLTSGLNAMSAHAVLADNARFGEVLANVQKRVIGEFAISHVTLQLEPSGHEENEPHL